MIFEVAVGDRVRTVSVVRKGALLHVTLDGHTHVVDARRVSDTALSLLVQNGKGDLPVQSIDAAFAPHATAGDFDVHLAGRAIAVQLRPSTSMTRRGASTPLRTGPAGAGPQRVVSPMPGKIVRLLVKTGDQVKAKQGLVVVEAMKMENELRAARDGRVREVSVAEGQSVDAGAVLLVVE
ncbi:MAG TPA: biotin/lipoyl-containing protein [Vicinamibacterales bacterium]